MEAKMIFLLIAFKAITCLRMTVLAPLALEVTLSPESVMKTGASGYSSAIFSASSGLAVVPV